MEVQRHDDNNFCRSGINLATLFSQFQQPLCLGHLRPTYLLTGALAQLHILMPQDELGCSTLSPAAP